MKKVQTTFLIEPDLLEKAKEYAEKNGYSFAFLIRELLRREIKYDSLSD